MRYTGPRGKSFSGDFAKAQSLQGIVDLLVGRVIKRLKAPPFNGTGHLVDRKQLPDGSWIGCMVNMIGMHPIVRTWIDSPSTASTTSATAYTRIRLDSGFFWAKNLTWADDGFIDSVQFLEARNGSLIATPWETSKELMPALCDTHVSAGWTYPIASMPVQAAYSGLYSGEMRKVVQLLYGTQVEQSGEMTTLPVLYKYARPTHGIFVAANQDRWVIEVDVTIGITAWRLPTLAISPIYGSDLPYTPAPIEALPSYSERRLLLPASDTTFSWWYQSVSDLYAHGWAFNANGHSAVLVRVTGGDEYESLRSHLGEIVINESNNAPISAAITVLETKYLHTAYDTLFMIKGPRTQEYFQTSRPWSPQPPAGEILNNPAPILAYYDTKTDERVVVYQNNVEHPSYPYPIVRFESTAHNLASVPGFQHDQEFWFMSIVVPQRERCGFYHTIINEWIIESTEYASGQVKFFHGGKQYVVIDEFVSNAFENNILSGPFVNSLYSYGSPFGEQFIDASLDAFTGIGTIARDLTVNGTVPGRMWIGTPNVRYDTEAHFTNSFGWFGAPFPE